LLSAAYNEGKNHAFANTDQLTGKLSPRSAKVMKPHFRRMGKKSSLSLAASAFPPRSNYDGFEKQKRKRITSKVPYAHSPQYSPKGDSILYAE